MNIHLISLITVLIVIGCGGDKNTMGSMTGPDRAAPVPPTPEPPPTSEPPPEPPPTSEPPPEPPPTSEPPPTHIVGNWSSIGTNLEANDNAGKLRKLLVDYSVVNEVEPDLLFIDMMVFYVIRRYTDLEINDDGTCRLGLSFSDFIEFTDLIEVEDVLIEDEDYLDDDLFLADSCRIDGNNIHVLSDNYPDDAPQATLILRVDGTRLVFWCDLEYHLLKVVEIDPMNPYTTEDELIFLSSIREIFVGLNRYENTFEKSEN